MAKSKRSDEPLVLPAHVVRKLALIRQGLWSMPDQRRGTPLDVLRSIGLVQIDSARAVERSHYIVLFSRLGEYDSGDLDRLIFPKMNIIEQWAHVASLIPFEDLPHYYPVVIARQRHSLSQRKQKALGPRPDVTLTNLLSFVVEHGTARAREADFLFPKRTETGWWKQSPARKGLDVLFRRGLIFVQQRTAAFEKCFVSSERFFGTLSPGLPQDTDESDANEWVVLRSLSCLGVGTVQDIADYYRLSLSSARDALERLKAKKLVATVVVEGWPSEAFAIKKEIPGILDLIRRGGEADLTTVLSPFDNLLWYRPRVERIFGFRYRNQMYKKTGERTHGYYLMPILSNGHIVGTLDPRVDRATATLLIETVSLDQSAALDFRAIAKALASLARFLRMQRIVLSSPTPGLSERHLKEGLLEWGF